MEPTITDWIQSGAALAALVLSIISLSWQFRTARDANAVVPRVVAIRHAEGVWTINVTVTEPPGEQGLSANLATRNPKGDRLFDPDLLPLEMPSAHLLRLNAPDYTRRAQVPKSSTLEKRLAHSHASSAVEAEFGLELPEETETATLRIVICGADRRRPLYSKTMLISPIA